MWKALTDILTGSSSQIAIMIIGVAIMVIGVSRKWQIEGKNRKLITRAGLIVLGAGLALMLFKEIMSYVD